MYAAACLVPCESSAAFDVQSWNMRDVSVVSAVPFKILGPRCFCFARSFHLGRYLSAKWATIELVMQCDPSSDAADICCVYDISATV